MSKLIILLLILLTIFACNDSDMVNFTFTTNVEKTFKDTFLKFSNLRDIETCKTNNNLKAYYLESGIKFFIHNENNSTLDSFVHKDHMYEAVNKIDKLDYYDDSTIFLYLSYDSHYQIDSHIMMINTKTKKVTVFNFGNDTNFITNKHYPTFELAVQRFDANNYYDINTSNWNTFLSKKRDFIIVSLHYVDGLTDTNGTLLKKKLIKLYVKESNKEPEYFKIQNKDFYSTFYTYRILGRYYVDLFSSNKITDSTFIVGTPTSPKLFMINVNSMKCKLIPINFPFLSMEHNWQKLIKEEDAVNFVHNPVFIVKENNVKKLLLRLNFKSKLGETIETMGVYDINNFIFLGLISPFDTIFKSDNIYAHNFSLYFKQKIETKDKYSIYACNKVNFNYKNQINFTAKNLYNLPISNLNINYANLLKELKYLNALADTVLFLMLEGGCPSCFNKVKTYIVALGSTKINKKVVILSSNQESIDNIIKVAKNKDVHFTTSSNLYYAFSTGDFSRIIFNPKTKQHKLEDFADEKVLLNTISPSVQLNGQQCFVEKE